MRLRILVGALLALSLVAGCGDDGDDASTRKVAAAEGPPNPKAAAAAEVICTQLVARAGRMGVEFSTGSDPTEGTAGALDLTTEKLIKPAIPILEGGSRQLRALKPRAQSISFDAYVNFYDPIVALLHERVEAGEAGDPSRARDLELQLIDFSAVQRRLAREAGLRACDVDFIQAFASGGRP